MNAPNVDEKPQAEPRQVAPKVIATAKVKQSKRGEIAAMANKMNPGFVHTYVSGETTQEDMAIREMEPVTWDQIGYKQEALKGKQVKVRNDVLVRVKRDTFEDERKPGEAMSRELVKRSMQKMQQDTTDPEAKKETTQWEARELVRSPRKAEDIGRPAN